jgi:hypothetical protein
MDETDNNGESSIPIPIDIRSHEVSQLDEFVPQIVERLRDIATEDNDLGSEADSIESIYDNAAVSDGMLSMEIDEWRTLLRHLPRLRDDEGLRVWWLQRKMIRRLKDRADEFGDN